MSPLSTVGGGAISGIAVMCLAAVVCLSLVVYLLHNRHIREPTEEHNLGEFSHVRLHRLIERRHTVIQLSLSS